MGVGGRHHNIFDRAIEFSGDLFGGRLPNYFRKAPLVGSDQSGASRAVIENDGPHIKFFVGVLAGGRISGIGRGSNVYARGADAQCSLGANGCCTTQRTHQHDRQLQGSPVDHFHRPPF